MPAAWNEMNPDQKSKMMEEFREYFFSEISKMVKCGNDENYDGRSGDD